MIASTPKPTGWMALPVALYIVSLTQPAIYVANQPHVEGNYLLVWGWFGFFTLNFAWMANPLLIGAWIVLNKQDYRKAAKLSGIAAALSLMTFTTSRWLVSENGSVPVEGFGPGAYAWLAAIAITAAGSAWMARAASRAGPPASE